MIYREYRIVHNIKPIPDRSNDWDWFPLDYDGPEDPRGGSTSGLTEAIACIDEEVGRPLDGAGFGNYVDSL